MVLIVSITAKVNVKCSDTLATSNKQTRSCTKGNLLLINQINGNNSVFGFTQHTRPLPKYIFLSSIFLSLQVTISQLLFQIVMSAPWYKKEHERRNRFQFSCSGVSDSLRPHGLKHARPPCPSPTLGSLPKFMSIESVMPSNHLILCCLLLLLPSIFPNIRVFSNESVFRIRWPKYWSFRISPSNEYSGLFSLRMDWLDLLAVQGTLKSLLQHHSSKASILWCSAFFIVQVSHDHWKNQSFD